MMQQPSGYYRSIYVERANIYMEGISFYEFNHIAAVRCLKYYTILTYF